MDDVLLLIAVIYFISISVGYILQKYLKMPWMFASLFFGLVLSPFAVFESTLQSETFKLLEAFGMYFLLFIIGFHLDFKRIAKLKKYVIMGTAGIIACEGLFGCLLLYFLFPTEVSNSLLIALVTALSFATVGEAVLMPILHEFHLTRTKFGQLTLGIGTLDDVVEVLMLAVVAILPRFLRVAPNGNNLADPLMIISGLAILLLLTFTLMKFGVNVKRIMEKNHPPPYLASLLTLFICFSFIALGAVFLESLATVGAIFGGMALRALLPKERLYQNERAVEFMGYIFLSPIFFFSIGTSVSVTSLILYPSMIVAIWVVAKGSKLLASFLLFRRLLGGKCSLLMGLGLSVRFSTSLIILFNLLNAGLISLALYSALIATAIFMKPVILAVYSYGLSCEKPP